MHDYRLPSLLVLLLMALPLQSCLFGNETKTYNSGRAVTNEDIGRIVPGSTPELVREVLGPPTSINKDTVERPGENPNETIVETLGEVWKYTFSSRTESRRWMFLIMSSRNETQHSDAIYIEFKDGKVTKTWRG